MALRRERMRLGDLLIKQNVLTEEQLKKALQLQKVIETMLAVRERQERPSHAAN